MITTIEQKELDSIAAKIPLFLWERQFDSRLDWDSNCLNNKPFDELRKEDLPQYNEAAFILLMIAYPKASGKQLYQFAVTELGINFKRMIELSAAMGHIELLKHLKKTDSKVFHREKFSVEWYALATGQLLPLYWLRESISWIGSFDSFERKSLTNGIQNTFNQLIKTGDLNRLEEFKHSLVPTKIDRLIGRALGQGNKPTPEKLKHLIKNEKFSAVRLACLHGQLEVLKWIKLQFNDEWGSMLKVAHGYMGSIIARGHLEVFKWLEQEMSSYWMGKTFEKNILPDYFDAAARNRHFATCRELLKYPHILGFAEKHQEDYPFVIPYIDGLLVSLHEAKRRFTSEHPNGVFNLEDEQQAKRCFYILRNLIRRYPTGPATLHDEFLFLLEIPAVKAMVHRSVVAGQSNDLLRLAQSVGNQRACSVLLAIPAVRHLAEHNNYYRNEALGGLDLQGLATDNESSMKMLTTGEQKRLANILDHYAPRVKKAGGVAEVMDDLRNSLSERYAQNPAKCVFADGREHALPEKYSDFLALNLNAKVREQALTAYYQHKDHTALRYISKPNHWMHPRASYVYINDERTERWSTFEDYQSLIANLYLAAIDKNNPATDGHTLEGRLEHFIDELAHLGRAHNWDSYRNKKGQNGKDLFNAKGQPIKEQYDDLTRDRPSCLSGVKRRLFQSVVGHPLLTLLSQDLAQQLLNERVRAYYQSVLTKEHQAALAVVLECITDGDDIPESAYNVLSAINLSQDWVEGFLLDLEMKYGDTASDFFSGIRQQFEFPENNDDPNFRRTHLLAFYLKAHLADLQPKSAINAGFFEKSTSKMLQLESDDPDWSSEFESAELGVP